MKIKLAIVFFPLSMLLLADDGLREPVSVTNTEVVHFAPGGVVRVTELMGNLLVEGWDRPEVEITSTKSAQGKQAAERLKDLHVVAEPRSATELAISVARSTRSHWSSSVSLELRIRVPSDSHLVIRHGRGMVSVSHVTGELEAVSRSGDIILMLPGPGPYAIDAKSKFGSVSSDFASGQTNSARRIFVRMGLGGIAIEKLPPEVH
jgi:hypothetical protein